MDVSIADDSCSPTRFVGLLDPEKFDLPRPKQSMWHRLGLRRWLGRDDRDPPQPPPLGAAVPTHSPKPHANLGRRLSRKVGVGLPRATTFKRQDSERRENLAPLEPSPRRAVSADRRTHRTLSAQRTRSPQASVDPRLSAPEVQWCGDLHETTVEETTETNDDSDLRSEWNPYPDVTDLPEDPPDDLIEMELEKRWILNLSMHFRDRSEREQFFVTYAETPTRWRRVTISCDYRNATPDSLEQDLKELRYQRDKCGRIYESIRESLAEIQFYDTVTNLKLETRDGRLHVHVTEDVNEIIPYPPVSCIGHLPTARMVRERELHFDAHLSGFVYNVQMDGKSYIKKEIPGPDTVDEFLYEINALHALQGVPSVVQVEGIVVDERQEVVKGLLIGYAEKGALVDILYENRGTISWERRERWARQIVHGLCEIHEAGYVQGDFTLSNIVVDANDNAKIIDINRRGCPVGWEPPEIAVKIESNQRISMYIGVKTDLFQLGMTLWALAMEEDEPERQPRPLVLDGDLPIPDYYRRIVAICLSPTPRHRLSAKDLLAFFPRDPMAGDLPLFPIPAPHPRPGVGLHSGVLPLYNPRTLGSPVGFLGPRPGPVDGSASVPLDRGDSLRPASFARGRGRVVSLLDEESPSRPPGGFERVRDDRNDTSSYELESFPPGWQQYWGDSSQPVPMAGTDLINVDQDSQGPSDLVRRGNVEVDSIDLDTDMVFHRKASADRPDSLGYPADSSGDLVGVGSHPCLRRDSAFELLPDSAQSDGSAASTAATQSSAPYPAPVTDLGDTLDDWPGPSRSVTSLLHSILPINPALPLSEHKFVETGVNKFSPLTIRSALGYSRQILQDTPFLNDSHLPINPALSLKESKLLEPGPERFPPSTIRSALGYPRRILQDTPFLNDSHLPINPAFADKALTPL